MSMKLNKEQQAAADFLSGICVVVAVPGAGKTLTMTHRIGNLVNKHGIAPESILGLTFTRNAADSMREKLAPVLNEFASRVHLATIHRFCHFLLRSEGRMFNILSGKEQVIFLRDIMKRLRIKDLTVGMVLREISLAKNNLIDVAEFRALYDGDKTMQRVGDVYEAYDQEKQKRLLMDFDDLLLEVFRLLNENELVREKYRGTFRHLLGGRIPRHKSRADGNSENFGQRRRRGCFVLGMWRRLAECLRVYWGKRGQHPQLPGHLSRCRTAHPQPELSLHSPDPTCLPEPHSAQYKKDRQGASYRQSRWGGCDRARILQ